MKKIVVFGLLSILLISSYFLFFGRVPAPKANDAPKTSWSKTYGGTGIDYLESMVQTSDGGYAMIGSTQTIADDGHGIEINVWLVKIDSNGNLQWSQTYGRTNRETGSCVIQTSDGGYALAGFTDPFTGNTNAWLVKIDSNGNLQWNQTYGGLGEEFVWSLVQTNDEGYALAGYTDSFGAGDIDFWLAKIDSSGELQWSQTYGGIESDYGRFVVQTKDGGYALVGRSLRATKVEAQLVKIDSNGNLQWNQTYGGTGMMLGESVVETSDGGYALLVDINSFDDKLLLDFSLVKTDSSGELQWSQTYGGTNRESGSCVIQTSDGGYAIIGSTLSFGAGGSDMWLVKMDSIGTLQWSQTYGGADWDTGNSVVQTSDGGYVIAGNTRSFGAGVDDFYLVKVGGGPSDFSDGMLEEQTVWFLAIVVVIVFVAVGIILFKIRKR